jgi:hypothetical protein
VTLLHRLLHVLLRLLHGLLHRQLHPLTLLHRRLPQYCLLLHFRLPNCCRVLLLQERCLVLAVLQLMHRFLVLLQSCLVLLRQCSLVQLLQSHLFQLCQHFWRVVLQCCLMPVLQCSLAQLQHCLLLRRRLSLRQCWLLLLQQSLCLQAGVLLRCGQLLCCGCTHGREGHQLLSFPLLPLLDTHRHQHSCRAALLQVCCRAWVQQHPCLRGLPGLHLLLLVHLLHLLLP